MSNIPADGTRLPLASPTTLTNAMQTTPSFSVAGYSEVDLTARVGAGGAGPITQIEVSFEYTTTASPASDADWTLLQTETVTLGVSTPSDYVIQQPVSGAGPYTRTWTAQVRGVLMRGLLRASVGDPTGSTVQMFYSRR